MNTQHPLFNQAIETIDKSQTILLVSHIRPDGDTLGSALALRKALIDMNKDVYNVCQHQPNSTYNFLPEIDVMKTNIPSIKYDLIITIDCGDLENMTGFYQTHQELFNHTLLINIDHHPSNNRFGDIPIVMPQTASVGQIMYYFLQALKVKLTPNMATQLLTALHFDTGSFLHPNSSPEIMRIASNLLHAGAQNKPISYFLHKKKNFSQLKLWGRTLKKLKIDSETKIASVFISQKDLEETGSTISDTEGLVGLIHGIKDVELTIVLTERQGNRVKASIRTADGKDASYYASKFGGGGHHKAAGFTINLKKEKAA